jgi:hypothetical protein
LSQELTQLSEFVTASYLEAGKGHIPLPVVATTTRVAYLAAKRIGQGISKHSVCNPDDLAKRFDNRNNDSICQHDVREAPCDSGGAVVDGLSRIWTTLIQLKRDVTRDEEEDVDDTTSSSSKTSNVNMRAFHDPYEFFAMGDSGASQHEAETASLETMLHIMIERIKELKASVVDGQKQYTCQRIMADLDAFLYDESEDPAHACHVSFGFHLLIVSYKAYLTGARQRPEGWKSTAVNPRLASLQVARTLEKELRTMLERSDAPCGCLKINEATVVLQLQELYAKLYNSVRTPRFDLLVQSPWISGEHMVQDLVLAARYGYKAWHHGWVWSINRDGAVR